MELNKWDAFKQNTIISQLLHFIEIVSPNLHEHSGEILEPREECCGLKDLTSRDEKYGNRIKRRPW